MLSPQELITFLTRYQFLSPSQGEALNQERSRFLSSVQLCGELVQRGWLTTYQQAQLLAGAGEKLIIGSYRIQAPLGEGGMGMVFKATQPKLERTVALKVIRPQVLAARPEILSRFHREAKAIAQLNHPNVVILFDADEYEGTHYIAMEYVDGQTLERIVRTQGPLPIRQACDYMRQAAEGLQHAHEVGLVHRDIKPSNILIAQKGGSADARQSAARLARPALVTVRDRERISSPSSTRLTTNWGVVKILDMGLARLTDGADEERPPVEYTPLTRAGALLGTPDFIAPEQARDARRVDIRADIYSLGCTFYYILTGKVPFQGGTDVQKLMRHQTEKPFPLEELRPGIPREVVQIVDRMMAKHPSDRYQTPRQLADALESFILPGLPSTPVPAPMAETPPVAETPVPIAEAARSPHPVAKRDPQARPSPSPAEVPESKPVEQPTVSPPPTSAKSPVESSSVCRIQAHVGLIGGLAFSSDSKLLASAGIDGRVRLWDLSRSTPTDIATFPKAGAEFQALAFAPHDDYIVVGGTVQGTARVWRWDYKEGKVAEWGAYQGHKGGVSSIAFAPDGRRIAAVIGPFVVLWKVSGRTVGSGEILKGHSGSIQAIAWSPDSKRLVSVGESRAIIFWGFGWFGASPKISMKGHSDVLSAVAFSPDGQRLAVSGVDGTIKIFDALEPSEQTAVTLSSNNLQFRLLHFLPDGSLLSVASSGRTIIWDLNTGRVAREYQAGDRISSTMTASADGRMIAFGSTDGQVCLL